MELSQHTGPIAYITGFAFLSAYLLGIVHGCRPAVLCGSFIVDMIYDMAELVHA